MARHDFLPEPEDELLDWSAAFVSTISSNPEEFGIDGAMAAQYSALHASFQSWMTMLNEPRNRCTPNVRAKNESKKALVADARRLVRIMQASPVMTNVKRATLQITLPRDGATETHVPPLPPVLTIRDNQPRRVRLQLHKMEPGRGWKPEDVIGAMIFSFVGDKPSLDMRDWSFERHTTRKRVEITFPKSVVPGAKVWFTACWLNTRLEPGPYAGVVSTHALEGVTRAA